MLICTCSYGDARDIRTTYPGAGRAVLIQGEYYDTDEKFKAGFVSQETWEVTRWHFYSFDECAENQGD